MINCLCSRFSASRYLLLCSAWLVFYSCHDRDCGNQRISSTDNFEQQNSKYNVFASAKVVDLDTESTGQWSEADDSGMVEWSLQISEDASSLNFGFSELVLPPSAKLLICDAKDQNCQEFLPSKSTRHHLEMWTPILKGGVANLKLTLQERERDLLRLRIATINKGFKQEDISRSNEQACLIDVLCLEDFPQIGNWESEIQSVALISIEGTRLCTGVLLNNVRQDFTPYFLTARHCGINAQNAASVVVHWNYVNSECRFGMESNNVEGDGSLTTFNSGASLMAELQRSDFTLLQLNDAVVPEANAYYAGWNASPETPSDVTTIHHANTEEKRITFGSGGTDITRHFGEEVDPNLDHIRVNSWAISSTSGGSSGGPLFDSNHRVVGQLHGGLAACGNEEPDWFGRFYTSWVGDSIPERQLKVWLDPDDTGVQEIDGTWEELAPLALQISVQQMTELICAGDMNASIQIDVANGNGPFRYSIDGGENFQNENIFANLGAGMFSVMVTDVDNITSAIVPFSITEPEEILIDYTQVYNQLILDVNGGVAPYLFSNNGDITFDSIFSNLPQGSNVFNVIDANGCSTEILIDLDYDEFQSQLQISTPITCHDSEDGAIFIQHTGSVAPYQYQLNNGVISNSNRFENLTPGNYSGSVIDSLGNTWSTGIIELVAPAELMADIIQTEEFGSVVVSGGVLPYTYSYDGGAFLVYNKFNIIDEVEVITVRDANSCEIELLNLISSTDTELSTIGIDLYPNPSTETIWLNSTLDIIDYDIINTQGQVLKSGDLNEKSGDQHSLDILMLEAGIYFFKANMRDGKSKLVKFIVL